jgi:hypothetical protein
MISDDCPDSTRRGLTASADGAGAGQRQSKGNQGNLDGKWGKKSLAKITPLPTRKAGRQLSGKDSGSSIISSLRSAISLDHPPFPG